MSKIRAWTPFLIAALLTMPGVYLKLSHVVLAPSLMTLLSGTSILCASFLLLWACDAAQKDISQTLALAVVALIAVLPEYAVDMYFTWQAGQHPDMQYAHYSIANMTGANRLLIGVAWGVIALICYCRFGRDIRLGKERRTDLLFLTLATIYAFIIPLKGSLEWYDGIVFLALYAWYIILASKRPCEEIEEGGPAEVLIQLPKIQRRVMTSTIFLFAAGVILANAQNFCDGLVSTGKAFGISEFVLIQWLAPIASEAPEFIVAIVFAWRGRPDVALGTLLSSKLNQWTLLVGMIPGVFALSRGTIMQAIPMDTIQMHEIFLTAAQSLLAIAMLACLRFTLANAFLLFALFTGQLIVPYYVDRYPGMVFNLGFAPSQVHLFFAVLYIMGSAALFLERPSQLLGLLKGFFVTPSAPKK